MGSLDSKGSVAAMGVCKDKDHTNYGTVAWAVVAPPETCRSVTF